MMRLLERGVCFQALLNRKTVINMLSKTSSQDIVAITGRNRYLRRLFNMSKLV